MIVCVCNNFNEQVVSQKLETLVEQGADPVSIPEFYHMCSDGDPHNCKKCFPALKEALEEAGLFRRKAGTSSQDAILS